MITGRGPGAPSVTGDMEFALRPAEHSQAVDLSAIRRTDAIADLLAARRLLRPRALGDPAITLLRALAADVDAADTSRTSRPARRGGAPVRRGGAPIRRGGAPVRWGGGPARRGGESVRPGTRRPVTADHRPLGPAGQTRRTSGWAPSAAAAAVITSAAAAVVAMAAVGLVVMGALTRLGGGSRHHMRRRMLDRPTGRFGL